MLIFGYNPKEVIKKYNENNKVYKIGAIYYLFNNIIYTINGKESKRIWCR
jgi:hypothetical protein